jgi:hypothetical protein
VDANTLRGARVITDARVNPDGRVRARVRGIAFKIVDDPTGPPKRLGNGLGQRFKPRLSRGEVCAPPRRRQAWDGSRVGRSWTRCGKRTAVDRCSGHGPWSAM